MPETPEKLFLIDTMSLVFRAFFAPMQMALASPSGMPTQAVFIFVRTLRKLLREHRPDYLAAAFDLAAPTFRDKLLEEYKANRQPFPEDLDLQMPYVRRFCSALGAAIVEREGYEADDIIGTLAGRASAGGLEVVIVSGDEDLFQLVNHNVCVLKPPRSARDREDDLFCDAEKVKEIIGVEPGQVVDWLALTGDPSDNIPGARPLPGREPAVEPGGKKRSYIGPKGATEIIRKFKTLDAALDAWQDAPKQTYRDALRDFRNEALLSRELATIRTDVPLDVSLEDLARGPLKLEELVPLCQELGFASLLMEFLDEAGPAPAQAGAAVEELQSPEVAEEWLRGLSPDTPLAIVPAIEGEEGFSAQLTGIGLAGVSRLASMPLGAGAERERMLAALRPALAGGNRIITHNAKLFHLLLKNEGLDEPRIADDTLLYSFLLDPLASAHSLDHALLRQQGRRPGASVAEAAGAARELAEALRPEIARKGLESLYRDVELPLAPVLADVERAGIRIDPAILRGMSSEFERNLTQLTTEIYQAAGHTFDLNSPRQLGEVLFERLRLPGGKRLRKSGQYSTDASVLEALAEQHELPRKILEYRTRAKLKSTYVDALPRYIHAETGRLHSSFNSAGSRTGRLSSSNPNLQNIPVGDEFGLLIRSAFVAAPGWNLITADYSQIELRVLAHMSEDALLIESFSRDEDIHSRTAHELFGVPPALQTHEHRRMAKAINYGVIYGLSAFGLAERTGASQSEAQHYIDEYFRRYHRVHDFIQGCVEQARETGEVRTLFGRLRPIPEIRSRDAVARNRAGREAMNTPLQGTAADLMKLAMIKVHGRLHRENMQTRIILTVHDELVLEAPEAEVETAREIVRKEMEGVHPLRVPLRVEAGVGGNWRDAK
ncbi:MAG: DNA polymerase I [Terriglobia bacterium]